MDNILSSIDHSSDAQTPTIVLELMKNLSHSERTLVPLIVNAQFAEKLSDSSKVYVTKDGIRMPKARLDNMVGHDNVSIIETFNEVSDVHIILDPPFNIRSSEPKYGLRDEALIRFTDSLPRLGPNKYAVITSPLGITCKTLELRWLSSLRDQGVYLQALAQLPAGSYPNTSISVVILIFSRKYTDKYLSLELKHENFETATNRIESWLSGTEKSTSDTNLVTFESGIPLITAAKLRRSNMLTKAYKKQGYPLVNLLDGAKINAVRKKGLFTDEVNAIYLPNIGLSNVVTTTSDMSMKNQASYFQIVLSDKFDADYVSRFLNTNIGKTIREDLMTNSIISKISLGTIRGELLLPLPNLMEQSKISALHNDIDMSINQLRAIQDDLTNHPKKLRELRTNYTQMIQSDDNAWVEILPSHLAIMLKKYYVAAEGEQYKRLLEFFEALNHLFAAIYFSFLKNSPDDKLWHSFKADSTDLDLDRVFNQSNFGSWYKFMSTAANYIRSLKAVTTDDAFPNKVSIDQAMDIMSSQLALDLMSTIISSVCKVAQDERNHDAHSFDSIQNTEKLKKLLNDIQPVLLSIFGHFKLVGFKQALAGESELRPYTVNVLHGSSAVFHSLEIELDRGINNEDIYLHELDTVRVLKMQPILKLMRSPSNIRNTIYYLDKKVGDDTVYKAYLDTGEAEVCITESGIEY